MRRTLGGKAIRMVYAAGGARDTTHNVPTPDEDRRRFCLSDDEVLTLADAASPPWSAATTRPNRSTPATR